MTKSELLTMFEQSRGQECWFTVSIFEFEETRDMVKETKYPYRIENDGETCTFKVFIGSINELRETQILNRIDHAKQRQLDKVIVDLFESGSSKVPYINNDVVTFIENGLKQCNIVANRSFDNKNNVKFQL